MLIDRLEREEGFRSHPYKDSRGILTIGIGFNIDTSGPGLTLEESRAVLAIRLGHLRTALIAAQPWMEKLDSVRFDVFEDMAYNMGLAGLLGFHRMLAMAEAGNHAGAAAAGLESKWATQVGKRAKDLMRQLETGVESD